ncbi:MAG: S8 family serine peptidase [Pseudomonadota bacterium]
MKTLSRRRPAWAVSLLALVCVCASAVPGAGSERAPKQRAAAVSRVAVEAPDSEARVIVKYRQDAALMRAAAAASAPAQHATALSARLGVSLTDGRAIGARAQVLRARGLGSKVLADRLAAQEDVEYAVVDERKHALAIPNDPLYAAGQPGTPSAGQWYLRPPSSGTIVDATSVVSAINAEGAWNITNGKRRVVIAVLDTGVRLDHPDLAPKFRPGYDFIANVPTANDGSGRDADPSDPGDGVSSADVGVVSGCTTAEVAPSTWHGTQTAGLIGAATNNGIGMAGAGRDVMMLPVRVLGKCGGFDSDIQAAMLWAAGLSNTPSVNPYPAKVINLSLGSTGACSTAYRDVIQQLTAAGVAVVVAAGNEGLGVGTPANCPGAIAVAGVRHAGTKVGYSDLGPEVAIAAPAGNCVNSSGDCLFPLLTTSNSGDIGPVAGEAGAIYTTGGTNASLGTSFSAPLVSGTVGLMLSANPTLTPAQLLQTLKDTARPFPATGAGAGVTACTAPTSVAQGSECYCTTTTCGAGLLDAGAAVASVAILNANIDTATTSVALATPITLDGGSSSAAAGRAVSTYAWGIVSGGDVAALTSAANASTATLQFSAYGSATVQLTVTDSSGATDTTQVVLTAPSPVATPAPDTGGGGGGGGAFQLGWLLAWMLGVGATALARPRRTGR